MFYVTCIMDVCGELETVGNDKQKLVDSEVEITI